MSNDLPTENAPEQSEAKAPEFAEVILTQLKARKVKPECAACKMFGWAGFEVNALPADRPTLVPPMVMREASVICKRCGYSMLFNLNILGIGVRQEERRVITPDQIAAQRPALVVP